MEANIKNNIRDKYFVTKSEACFQDVWIQT